MYKFHKKKSVDIEVDFLRFSKWYIAHYSFHPSCFVESISISKCTYIRNQYTHMNMPFSMIQVLDLVSTCNHHVCLLKVINACIDQGCVCSVCNTLFYWLTFSLERLTRLKGKMLDTTTLAFTLRSCRASPLLSLRYGPVLQLHWLSTPVVMLLWNWRQTTLTESSWIPRYLAHSPLCLFLVFNCYPATRCCRVLCTLVWPLSKVQQLLYMIDMTLTPW